MMPNEFKITTRKLLREFKSVKNQLLSGKVDCVLVEVGDEQILEIKQKPMVGNLGDILDAAQYLPKDINIKRNTNIWGDYEKRLVKRVEINE